MSSEKEKLPELDGVRKRRKSADSEESTAAKQSKTEESTEAKVTEEQEKMDTSNTVTAEVCKSTDTEGLYFGASSRSRGL